jgi:hypothetical protein
MANLSQTLLQQQGRPAYVVPCTVTQVSPPLVTLLGATNVPAVRIANTTVSLGAANCLVISGAEPILLPIG